MYIKDKCTLKNQQLLQREIKIIKKREKDLIVKKQCLETTAHKTKR